MDHYSTSRLRENLLKQPGVPNASYQHRNGQIFIFDLLLHLVARKLNAGNHLSAAVRDCFPHSIVPPLVAVQQFKVMPDGFCIVRGTEQQFLLYHEGLGASVARDFLSIEDAERAAAHILCAGALSCVPPVHFFYAELPMRFLLDLQTLHQVLPPRLPDDAPYQTTTANSARHLAGLQKLNLPSGTQRLALRQREAYDQAKAYFIRTLRNAQSYEFRADFFGVPPLAARVPDTEISLFGQIGLVALHQDQARLLSLQTHLCGELLTHHLDSVGVWVAACADHTGSREQAFSRGLDLAEWWLRVYPEMNCVFKAAQSSLSLQPVDLRQGKAVIDNLATGIFEA